MTDDQLEILIGKLLDGELSPKERHLLDRELERDSQARELLEQLQTLRESSREVVASEVLEPGAGPEEIFERAWQRSRKRARRRILRPGGYLRFAAGLAAGFLLGLSVHFVLVWGSNTADRRGTEASIARGLPDQMGADETTAPTLSWSDPERVMRKVDWYGFTDDAGNQWLVEGVREGVARPAAYYGDL